MTTVNSVCPRCFSQYAEHRGGRNGKSRLHCKNCGKWYTEITNPHEIKVPKILCFDIETLPLWLRAWDLYPHYHSPENIIKPYCILSWSAKWLFSPEKMGNILTPKQALSRDDSGLMKEIYPLFNEAEIVIAHNGKRFDARKVNTRLLYHGYTPPRPYKLVDTWKASKDVFDFSSNKLDWINRYLELNTKDHTDYQLWIDCDEGNPEALKTMMEYNLNDVGILEEMYVKIRPWIPQHPNMNCYVSTDEAVCPTCGTKDIVPNGNYATPANVYTAFRCNNCGAVGRSSNTSLSTVKRKNMVRVV